jgi:hypothetical protein
MYKNDYEHWSSNVYPLAAGENSYGDFKMNICVRLIGLLFFYGVSWN